MREKRFDRGPKMPKYNKQKNECMDLTFQPKKE
jgi:hypothetical protein